MRTSSPHFSLLPGCCHYGHRHWGRRRISHRVPKHGQPGGPRHLFIASEPGVFCRNRVIRVSAACATPAMHTHSHCRAKGSAQTHDDSLAGSKRLPVSLLDGLHVHRATPGQTVVAQDSLPCRVNGNASSYLSPAYWQDVHRLSVVSISRPYCLSQERGSTVRRAKAARAPRAFPKNCPAGDKPAPFHLNVLHGASCLCLAADLLPESRDCTRYPFTNWCHGRFVQCAPVSALLQCNNCERLSSARSNLWD